MISITDDTVLNIDTECDSRRNLTKGLLTKVDDIRDDVLSAIQDRDITSGRRLLCQRESKRT
jgi:hypothetical protein